MSSDPVIQHICSRLAHLHLGIHNDLIVLAENIAFLIRHECSPSALQNVNRISITFVRESLVIDSPIPAVKATVTVHENAGNLRIIAQAGVQPPKTDIIGELYCVVEETVCKLLGLKERETRIFA